jgi:hypothetical protein
VCVCIRKAPPCVLQAYIHAHISTCAHICIILTLCYLTIIKVGPKPRVQKFGKPTYQKHFGNSDRCKWQYRTWVETWKWDVEPIGVRCLGKRASGSAAAGLVPRAGHPPEHIISRHTSDATRRAALLPRHPLHPHKRSAWHCCGACAGLAGRGCVRSVTRYHQLWRVTC